MAAKPIRGQLWQELLRALEYVVVCAYFFLWSYKTEIRKYLKISALSTVSFSTLLLYSEMMVERYGANRVLAVLESVSTSWGGNLVFYLFGASVAFLTWHHWEEAGKPGYEFVFVQRLCDFLEGRGTGNQEAPTVPESLELFHSVFKDAGITHASVHRWTGQELTIQPTDVFPEEKDPAYFVRLASGEGVAGRVWDDLRPRYLPRLYFPFPGLGLFFPHAVSYTFERSQDGGHRLALGDERIDFRVFKRSTERSSKFRAFLSVPVKSVSDGKPHGVLNFDFVRSDPLNKVDIAMAVILGLLLGDELSRTEAGGSRGRQEGQR